MQLLFLGGGLWLVLVLMFIIGAWLVYQAWAASKSNSTVTKGGVTTDNTGNVPMYKQGKFLGWRYRMVADYRGVPVNAGRQMNPILFQAIYIGWVIFFAYMNKLWIAKNYPFRHWANAIAHLSAAGFAGFHFGWHYGVAILFLVRVVFDGTLSLFRGLSFDYVSPKPASIIDRLEKRVFGRNGLLPKLLYLLTVIILNVWASR